MPRQRCPWIVLALLMACGGDGSPGQDAVDAGATVDAAEADAAPDAALPAPDAGPPPATGDVMWARSYDQAPTIASDDRFVQVAELADGSVVTLGRGQPLADELGRGGQPAGNDQILVVRYAPDGQRLWTHAFGGCGDDVPARLAISDDDDIFVAGQLGLDATCPGLDFAGAIALPPASGQVAFVAALSADGGERWIHLMSASEVAVTNLAVADDAGAVVLRVAHSGELTWAQGDVFAAGTLLVVLDATTGATRAHRRYEQLGHTELATDGHGQLLLFGVVSSSLDLGGAVLPLASGQQNYVAALPLDLGPPIWQTILPLVSDDFTMGDLDIAAAPDGNPVLAVSIYEPQTLDGVTYTPTGQAGILVLHVVDGVITASALVDEPGNDRLTSLAVDAWGEVLLDSWSLEAGVSPRVELRKCTADGQLLWSKALGSAQHQDSGQLAVGRDGSVAAVGSFGPTFSIGDGLTAQSGGFDAWVARLAP
jgi:hypothetical protein